VRKLIIILIVSTLCLLNCVSHVDSYQIQIHSYGEEYEDKDIDFPQNSTFYIMPHSYKDATQSKDAIPKIVNLLERRGLQTTTCFEDADYYMSVEFGIIIEEDNYESWHCIYVYDGKYLRTKGEIYECWVCIVESRGNREKMKEIINYSFVLTFDYMGKNVEKELELNTRNLNSVYERLKEVSIGTNEY